MLKNAHLNKNEVKMTNPKRKRAADFIYDILFISTGPVNLYLCVQINFALKTQGVSLCVTLTHFEHFLSLR